MAWLPRMSCRYEHQPSKPWQPQQQEHPPAGARTASVARACRSSGTTSAATAAVAQEQACMR